MKHGGEVNDRVEVRRVYEPAESYGYRALADRVGADNAFTSCDLRILMEEAAMSVVK